MSSVVRHMRQYIAPIRAVILCFCLLGLWLYVPRQSDMVANFDFSQFYIGDVNSELLFQARFHTFVIDDTESCYVPPWIPVQNTTGTLVTIKEGCEAPEGWNAVSHMASTPVVLSLWLCSQSDKMLCLLINNSGSTPFGEIKAKQNDLNPLDSLTKQTLAMASNEDCVWRCNDNFAQSCLVVPGRGSYCLMEKVRDELSKSRNKNWPSYVEQCRLNYHKLDWYQIEDEIFEPPEE
ncbi:YALI0B02464p [Yarrowia lipolytica CLIB122]|uniref:YALI0B02464p n=2 Tax=Yarrowia lipolytica TaxID=4952 RepID=Q6CFY5_YARLI|nr:YALI0B02464p [Yarrowia lipolytica CLIB122]AOW01127.1 hypothetical protein YALI1_B03853g [Yarrowia lipolytica]KAB8285240.1 hypothetical protein BKA91DRAFT_133451 [Yarrowia lipolytica]KAE8174864.1 hypothetical protein BKA90DRAFT_133044 [Yarrowia lipolytica]KAJ8052019.1 hypothetical protein LXG23DRAFT_38082 [Yarrowia lipolytica]RMJ00733.1 hypothetical protein BD777DRAFT_121197 [Yarrowia lipolytica]|eukprot:XP_500427.1 YALI0B02464p [Yarrowia lipolytica CLIB122]